MKIEIDSEGKLSFTKSSNGSRDLAKISALLNQDQITGAVRRALESPLDPETLAFYKEHIACNLDGSKLLSEAPFWVNMAGYLQEPLKLNTSNFWMDILCQAGAADNSYLIGLVQSSGAMTVESLARNISLQNNKFYSKFMIFASISALTGTKLNDCVKDQYKYPNLYHVAQSTAETFGEGAANFNELLRRLRQLYPNKDAETDNPLHKPVHNLLIEGDGFKMSVLDKQLACPAVGLTGMIFSGYGVMLDDTDYIKRFRSRITYPA